MSSVDPVHSASEPDAHWTTTNIGEGMPGVQTPLSWSVWYPAAHHGLREAVFAMGVLTRAERRSESPRFLDIFHGRGALLVELLALIGDRLPGTSGEDAVRSLFGRVPEDLAFHPTRRRYPVVAWRFPRSFLRGPRMLQRFSAEQHLWWRDVVSQAPAMSLPDATRMLVQSRQRFEDSTVVQAIVGLNGIQPVYDALTRVVDRVGAGDLSKLTSPSGGAEMAVVSDIWRASRGELALEDIVAEHGFHGPREGDVASCVWREDSAPLRRLIEQYAVREDHASPAVRDQARRAERHAVERELLDAAPRHWRAPIRVLLRLTRSRLPLRGVAKRSMLQGLDGARASARRIGELLAADGTLPHAEDVFYFTIDELVEGLAHDARDIVAVRRERHEAYATLSLPGFWKGTPEPTGIDTTEPSTDTELMGIGVSAGVVEGTARVVTNPDFADVEPDEILIAPTTDPSWSSIMFISRALVVDIGGALSHAAVVARELDIPCVVNARGATAVIKTGDRIRVDGNRGTVEILERADALAILP